jgi:hypothetical protein
VVLPACYELDAAKLLDFPLITDMRDPLTMRFHRAKLWADLVRPNTAEDLLDNPDAAREYLGAVERYVTAFNAAEAAAIADAATTFRGSNSSGYRVPKAFCA